MRKRPVREPCWIVHSHLFDPDEYECSECGSVFRKAQKVCPACGATVLRQKEDPEWVDEAEFLDWMMEED